MRVNKANFHMKGFALGLALKQRQNAPRKSPIAFASRFVIFYYNFYLVKIIQSTIMINSQFDFVLKRSYFKN